MNRKINFILQTIWKDNRKLLVLSAAQLPLQVLLPWLQIFLTRTLVMGIERQDPLYRYAAGIGSIFLLQMGVNSLKEWVTATAEWENKTLVYSLSAPMDEKTLTTAYANVEGAAGQRIRQRALNAVYAFGQSVVLRSVSFLVNLCGLLFYGLTIGRCDPAILAVVTVTTGGGYLAAVLLRRCEQRQKETLVDCDRKMNYLENEGQSLQAARELRLYDMAGLFSGLYRSSMERRKRSTDRIAHVKALVCSGESLLAFVRNFVTYYYLIHLAVTGRILVGDLVLMTGMAAGLSVWMRGLIGDAGELKRLGLYLDDYFAWLDLGEAWQTSKKRTEEISHEEINAEAISDGAAGNTAAACAPSLTFEHVGFCYEGAQEDTLRDITLTVRAGEKMAIVGRNGAGKTTLVKLLSGLYRPDRGRILLDGEDITGYSDEAYFARLAVVFQDIQLLPVSIAENVSSHIRGKTDRQRVAWSLEQAGIGEKVRNLPAGEDTCLQRAAREDAVELSGGEQQKTMLAKALYKGGDVLILDEPTAALDPIAENDIYRKYNEMTQGVTSFFISHRLASTSFCDRIILLEDGRIAEQGTHEELLAKRGRYWEMFNVQSRYYTEGGRDDF